MRACRGFRSGSDQYRLELFFTVIKADRLRWHDGGNRVLVDKLGLTVTAQQNAEIVEPCDDALQLHTVDQKDRYGDLGFAHMVKECVLQVLFVGSHRRIPFIVL